MKVSEQVEVLEEDRKALITLCSEMVLTYNVNVDRGLGSSLSQDAQAEFQRLVNNWQKRLTDVVKKEKSKCNSEG